jgi:DNA-directed RNA polymerase specialized sigma24 family protein
MTALTETDLESLRRIARQEAAKQLTVSGGHEMDDVVQSSMLEYLAYAAKNEVGNPGGLMRVIARFRAMKFRDKWESRRADTVIDAVGVPRDDDRGRGLQLAAATGDPLAALLVRGEAQLVAYALGKLEPLDREIARLTFLCESPWTAPVVAERVGLAAGTVRNRLVRIRRTLAQLLDLPSD